MKKILFLSFNYPEGGFGPSTLCTTRIMNELVSSNECEVHCLSYDNGGKNTYPVINGVTVHKLGIKPKRNLSSRFLIHMFSFFKIPLFPFNALLDDYKHYKDCKRVLGGEKYDLVVAQYAIEQCLIAGVLLKKNHCIDNLMILFWDNIYGKLPQRVIPKGFAGRRQYKIENWIAKYADTLVSLYPIKSFHKEYGDVPNAKGKRIYLGIPSVVRPESSKGAVYKSLLKKNKINMVISGTIFKKNYLVYFIELLNKSFFSQDINFIVFTRSISKEEVSSLNDSFNGTIEAPGYIPLNELLAIYPEVDFFVSFPGAPTAICSRVYEYMSHGKPLILLYEDDKDVNISTFSKYPYCESFDCRLSLDDNLLRLDKFIKSVKGKTIPFEQVENIFQDDTASAYVKMILKHLQQPASCNRQIII